jgi:hypothetical protein
LSTIMAPTATTARPTRSNGAPVAPRLPFTTRPGRSSD